MLSNPGVGPNATIMRWIEDVLLYHFTLRHVPGKTFSVDGLSRRPKYPGDEEYPPVDPELMDKPKSMLFEYPDKDNQVSDWEKWEPLQLEEFADEIDTRGGYLQLVAAEISDFDKELNHARIQEQELRTAIMSQSTGSNIDPVAVLALSKPLLPVDSQEERVEDTQTYLDHRKGSEGEDWDNLLPLVKSWLQNPGTEPQDLKGWDIEKFKKFARQFFFDPKGRLYRRNLEERHKLVVNIDRRMYMLKAAHDALGHRGAYATKMLIQERFWWPGIDGDVQ
ncbi:hypothetical protein C0992_011841, partial [Termitomyces sp. T32_za158]